MLYTTPLRRLFYGAATCAAAFPIAAVQFTNAYIARRRNKLEGLSQRPENTVT